MRDERTVVASSIIHKSIEEAIKVPLQMNTDKSTSFLIFLEQCYFYDFCCSRLASSLQKCSMTLKKSIMVLKMARYNADFEIIIKNYNYNYNTQECSSTPKFLTSVIKLKTTYCLHSHFYNLFLMNFLLLFGHVSTFCNFNTKCTQITKHILEKSFAPISRPGSSSSYNGCYLITI